jgi:hypothetical protein
VQLTGEALLRNARCQRCIKVVNNLDLKRGGRASLERRTWTASGVYYRVPVELRDPKPGKQFLKNAMLRSSLLPWILSPQ